MNLNDLLKYRRIESKSSQLQNLSDTFYEDVAEYCKDLELNKQYDVLKNVLGTVDLIKTVRLKKIFDKALVYVHQGVKLEEINEETIPNLNSLECNILLKFVKALQEYDHIASEECEFLKK